MTGVLALADADGSDDHVLDHVLCRCGGLAAIVMAENTGEVSVAVRCDCGAFAAPEPGERA